MFKIPQIGRFWHNLAAFHESCTFCEVAQNSDVLDNTITVKTLHVQKYDPKTLNTFHLGVYYFWNNGYTFLFFSDLDFWLFISIVGLHKVIEGQETYHCLIGHLCLWKKYVILYCCFMTI